MAEHSTTAGIPPGKGDEAAEGRPQAVPVNVYEAERALVVVAAMPGVMPEDITVTVQGRRLTIAADLRTAAPKDYLRHEWHYGPYRRTLELPEGFAGKGEARYANGQLALRLERGDAPAGYVLAIEPDG